MRSVLPRQWLSILIAITAFALHPSLRAQSPDAVASVKQALLEDVTTLLQGRVLPVMQAWKQQFDASIAPRDRAMLEQLRERYAMLTENLRHNVAARDAARDARDYASISSLRPLLERNFQERQRMLADVTRLAQRNRAFYEPLAARIDSSAEEWRAAAMRLFVDWFARHRHVITPAMNGPMRDALASLMLSCKNVGLDQLPEHAHVAFLLWDGEDFTAGTRERGFPVTPLTSCRLDRGDVFLLEDATPNPFRDESRIRFLLPDAFATNVRLVNGRGREIRQLLGEELPVGKHMVTLRADGLEAGTYYVVVEAGDLFDVIAVRRIR